MFLEQTLDQALLTRPGIGENDGKINKIESQFVVCIVRIRDEPEILGAVIG